MSTNANRVMPKIYSTHFPITSL